MRCQPALRTLPAYYDHPAISPRSPRRYAAGLAALDFDADAIVASFHGMPKRTLERGDPYHCQCRKTARLLGEALGRELTIAFQSRFGRAKWLEPVDRSDARPAAGRGIEADRRGGARLSADCLETLEEMAIRGRETFWRRRRGVRLSALPQ